MDTPSLGKPGITDRGVRPFGRGSRRRPKQATFQPQLECLEERTVLATIRWTNSAGGYWHVAGNWDLNRLPAAGDDVVIDAPGNYNVFFQGQATVASLLTTKYFAIVNQGFLTVRGPVTAAVSPFIVHTSGFLLGATITTGTTISGHGGDLISVINRGTVAIPNGGGISLSGAWRNEGVITASGAGRLNLGGGFRLTDLGDIRPGGIIALTGRLLNQGTTLALNDTTGSWHLAGGTIDGGTVTTAGSGQLVSDAQIDRNGGTLNGVTLNGLLNVRSGVVTVTNGLRLNGMVTIDNYAYFSSASRLDFLGEQTLDGTGTIVFGTFHDSQTVGGAGALLTIPPTITVRGGLGHLVNFVNRGTIRIEGAGANLTFGGNLWRNQGAVVLASGTLSLGGTFRFEDGGTITRISGNVDLRGTLDNTNRTLTLNATTGTWRLVGGTVRGGTVTTTGGATLNLDFGGTLDGVRIDTNLELATGHLILRGAWSNRGTLNVRGGDLVLDGTFTPADLGALRRTGGRVLLSGTVNNAGSTLALTADTGSWTLAYPTINGGVITTSGGAQLFGSDTTGSTATFNGVTLNGQVTIANGSLTVLNGLTVNGALSIGTDQTPAKLFFRGPQTLTGTGVLSFGFAPASLYVVPGIEAQDGLVTISPNLNVRVGVATFANIVIQATIILDRPNQRLTLQGTWRNGGTIRLADGNLDLGSTFRAEAIGALQRTGGAVNLVGTLDNRDRTFTLDAATGSWNLRGGTIDGGVFAAKDGAALFAIDRFPNLFGVTLRADLHIAPAATVTLAGANWSNQATITVNGGTLDLANTFTTADLGTIHRPSGRVRLMGHLDNRGGKLTLDDVTGPWEMVEGSIRGGTLTTQGGAYLELSFYGGNFLDGVAVNGDLRLREGSLRVSGGLTLDGTLTVGPNCRCNVIFNGGQAMEGNGAIVFADNSDNYFGTTQGAVTLGPGITVRGGVARLQNVVNRGTVMVEAGAALITLDGNSWRNEGTIAVSAGTLNLGGTFPLAALGNLVRTGGTVNLVGTLDNRANLLLLDAATGSWQLAGGTVLGGTLVTRDGAELIPTSSGGTLDSVQLLSDLTLPSASRLTLAGTWRNRARLTVNGGTLRLGGFFTLATLGELRRTGGVIQVAGTLENAGRELLLDAATGAWQVDGGVIRRGTVTTRDNVRLLVSGTLDGVRVNGTVEVTNSGRMRVLNGLALVGQLLVGTQANGSGTVEFVGSQTLSGIATVQLGSVGASNAIFLDGVGGTLTLAPGITVRGTGRVSNFLNQGTILADLSNKTLTVSGAWRNEGTLRLTAGTLNFGGTFARADLGTFQRTGGTVNLTGTLDNRDGALTLNATTGSWQLLGGTLWAGALRTADGGQLLTTPQGGTFDGVSIETNLTVSQGTALTLRGTWQDRTRLTLAGGTLNLNETFTLADLRDIQIHPVQRGTLNLAGTLNLTNDTLALDDSSAVWRLSGGTVVGGTIRTTGNSRFITIAGTLSGITVNGRLDGFTGNIRVVNGLTLNGQMDVGQVLFVGSQSLTGTGTVTVGLPDQSNNYFLRTQGGQLTLGPGITVRAGRGFLDNFINRGTIELDTPGADLVLEGSWRNEGLLRLVRGRLVLGGTFPTSAVGNVQRTGGSVYLAGVMDNRGTTLTLTAATGSWYLGGTILGGAVATRDGARLELGRGTLNGVRIDTDLDLNRSSELTLLGNWTNRGRLRQDSGTLNLGGTFTMADLGNYQRTFGELNLTGTLENVGRALSLDGSTGVWYIRGGTINGGTIRVARDRLLQVHSNPDQPTSRFHNVTVEGFLNIFSAAIVTGGLTNNGTITLGSTFGERGILSFDGSQVLGGTGTVALLGDDTTNLLNATRGTLTIGPGQTVRVMGGRLGGFVNEGTILVETAQSTATLEGAWRNAGMLRLTAGTLNLGGTFTVDGLGTVQRTGGTVNLSGTLNNNGTTLALNAATGSWNLRGGTVLGGTVSWSQGAALVPTSFGGTLNGVLLQSDLLVENLGRIAFTGSWRHQGRLTLRSGEVELGGTFTTAALGQFQRTGGSVMLTGTLDNTGSTLELNAATGSWNLLRGTIRGGLVNATEGARLLNSASFPAALRDLKLNGDLDVIDGSITLSNVTLNGTVTLGRDQFTAALLFSGQQTLAGRATIVFQGTRDPARNALAVISSNGSLTLGPDVVVRGVGGTIGFSSAWSGSAQNVTVINEGLIRGDEAGATLTVAAATFINRGGLEVYDGSTLALQHRGAAGGLLNLGTIYVAGGTLTVDDVLTQLDGITLLVGGILTTPLLDLQGGLLQGSGIINGSVRNDTTVAVGFEGVPGVLAVAGDYTQGSTGVLRMQLGGYEPGVTHDHLVIGGRAVLDGRFVLTVLDDFFANPDDLFTLMEFGEREGEFVEYAGMNPKGQEIHFEPLYDAAGLSLLAVPN